MSLKLKVSVMSGIIASKLQSRDVITDIKDTTEIYEGHKIKPPKKVQQGDNKTRGR